MKFLKAIGSYRIEFLNNQYHIKLKNSSYKTILELTSSGEALGLITREYVNKNDYKRLNLIEVKTSIKLGKIEFGIYTNSNRFKELNNLIKIIKDEFQI